MICIITKIFNITLKTICLVGGNAHFFPRDNLSLAYALIAQYKGRYILSSLKRAYPGMSTQARECLCKLHLLHRGCEGTLYILLIPILMAIRKY